MQKKRRVMFITVIIIAITVLSIFMISFSPKVKFVCYDKQKKIIFFYGDDAPFLENVVSPFWSEDFILAVFDDGKEAFIGKYIIKEGEWQITEILHLYMMMSYIVTTFSQKRLMF